MLEIGSVIDGKYKILNIIGRGGMSIVYLAMNERANRQWAVKEIRRDIVLDGELVRQSLITETELLKRLHHPNLPGIADVIDREDSILIVMDYVEGRNLAYHLEKEGAQPPEKVADWAVQICDVLGYLHSRQPPIIYRDLKPANLMLRPDGRIMLIDFGTAREMHDSAAGDTACLGTQGYAAPEQYGGCVQTDARTDIYALGAVMYHLLTGHYPGTPPYGIYPIRKWNPQLSQGLEKIILKCTRQNPAKRYQDCTELMYALQHYTELDDAYRVKQAHKLNLFLTFVLAAALSLTGCIGFHELHRRTKSTTYDAWLTRAAEEADLSDFETVFSYYEAAVSMNPGEAKAYDQMLKYCFNNNGEYRISTEEYNRIDALMGEYAETFHRQDEDGYIGFCYQLGVSLFYYYDTQFQPDICNKWLSRVINADEKTDISEIRRETAKVLYAVAKFADGEIPEEQEGDLYGSELAETDDTTYRTYADYWDGLMQITENLSVFTDAGDDVMVITVYESLAKSICDHANDFKNAGITRIQLEEKLTEAQQVFVDLQEQGVTNYTETMWEELQSLVESAAGRVETAYGGTVSNTLATEGGVTGE